MPEKCRSSKQKQQQQQQQQQLYTISTPSYDRLQSHVFTTTGHNEKQNPSSRHDVHKGHKHMYT